MSVPQWAFVLAALLIALTEVRAGYCTPQPERTLHYRLALWAVLAGLWAIA